VKSPDAARRAATLEIFLRTAFAHPAVEQFLVWGFWGGAHWLGWEASLVGEDFALAPPMQVIADLRRLWTTRVEAVTDAAGRFTLAGYTGTYRISAAGRMGSWRLGRDAPASATCACA
jgi:endo-1,4-beta-xylanase